MSERSIELVKQSINGTSKYDYFIVGIGAATFSFFAKDYVTPELFGMNEGSFVIISLLCLALSVVFGLKKIERYNKFLEKNGKYLDYSEYLAAYKKNVIERSEAINSESGEILTPETSWIKAAALEEVLPEQKKSLERLGDTIWWCSVVRDYGVFIGYCSLALGKLLPLFGL